jgi:hypothetical protein
LSEQNWIVDSGDVVMAWELRIRLADSNYDEMMDLQRHGITQDCVYYVYWIWDLN